MNYIPSLDGIRTISVFLVLFSHAGLGHLVPGGLGVTVFFFLSGFLITTLLVKEFDKNSHINYPFFFVRRFFRLFPPLFVTLILAYGLHFSGWLGGSASWEGLLSQLFYLANYHAVLDWPGGVPHGLEILWSLAVEEHFYLFFPMFLSLCLSRLSVKEVASVLVVICGLILSWRFFLVLVENVSEIRISYATDTRFDSILFGCILALTWNPVYVEQSPRLSPKAWFLLAVAGALMMFSLLFRTEVFRETARYTLQGVALMPLFYYAVKCGGHPIFAWLNWNWMRKLGVYSYAIYLIHMVVIRFLDDNNAVDGVLPTLLVSIVFSIFFAMFIDKFVDPFFQRLRKKFRPQAQPHSQPSLVSASGPITVAISRV